MGYGSKHVRFSAERPVFRGRNQHFLRSGKPKVRYDDLLGALDVVCEMRSDGKDVQGYLCKECQGYHVGNRRFIDMVPDRDIALFTELGDRVYAHMRVQNRHRKKRLRSVIALLKRAEDKRLYGSPTSDTNRYARSNHV